MHTWLSPSSSFTYLQNNNFSLSSADLGDSMDASVGPLSDLGTSISSKLKTVQQLVKDGYTTFALAVHAIGLVRGPVAETSLLGLPGRILYLNRVYDYARYELK